jgi:hypothetical protein
VINPILTGRVGLRRDKGVEGLAVAIGGVDEVPLYSNDKMQPDQSSVIIVPKIKSNQPIHQSIHCIPLKDDKREIIWV